VRTLSRVSIWVRKKHELICLFGASRKSPKELPNGQKPPIGQENPEKRVFENRKNGFLVLFEDWVII
jgi:hypothetical protein